MEHTAGRYRERVSGHLARAGVVGGLAGGFGMAMSMYASDRKLPIAKFCDLGNTADVEVHEIIDYFADDPQTRIIGLFLESVPSPNETLRALRAAAARKPIVVTPVGVHPF